jgi:Lrp/AsnC family leucine-responsive transcriptional regulator
MIDHIDYRLLELLQSNGRASQMELGKKIGLSQPAVAERIRKLEEQGTITGYTALVDARRVGKDITAFIGVFTNHPRHNYSFAKRVGELPEVLECYRVAGSDSYLLKVKTENTSTLDELIAHIRHFPGVERTQTTIAIASIKETLRVMPASNGEASGLEAGSRTAGRRAGAKLKTRREQ